MSNSDANILQNCTKNIDIKISINSYERLIANFRGQVCYGQNGV